MDKHVEPESPLMFCDIHRFHGNCLYLKDRPETKICMNCVEERYENDEEFRQTITVRDFTCAEHGLIVGKSLFVERDDVYLCTRCIRSAIEKDGIGLLSLDGPDLPAS
jgi:hypothetical protein